MKRKFNNLNDIAYIKNTGYQDSAVVPYGSRTSATKIESQEEFPFEISSASKAFYYYKQQNEDLKAENLYNDGSEPEPPVENKLKIVNNSSVTFKFRVKEAGINISVESGGGL